MNKEQIFIFAIAFFLLTATSCESDQTAPAISFSTPSQNSKYEPGDTIDITATAADDIEVADIIFTSTLWPDLDTCTVTPLSGSLFWKFSKSLIIPDTTSQSFHTLTATVTDNFSNPSSADLAFEIINDLDPELNIFMPQVDTVISLGDTLHIRGLIKDDIKLKNLTLTEDALLYDVTINNFDSDTSHLIFNFIHILDTIPPAEYNLMISVIDSRDQVNQITIPFKIMP